MSLPGFHPVGGGKLATQKEERKKIRGKRERERERKREIEIIEREVASGGSGGDCFFCTVTQCWKGSVIIT